MLVNGVIGDFTQVVLYVMRSEVVSFNFYHFDSRTMWQLRHESTTKLTVEI